MPMKKRNLKPLRIRIRWTQHYVILQALKNKAQATNEMLNKKINDIQKELDGKVHAIKEQIKDANEKRKAKLQKRMGTMQEEYKVRMAKLKKASVLINEALTSKPEAKKNETVSV